MLKYSQIFQKKAGKGEERNNNNKKTERANISILTYQYNKYNHINFNQDINDLNTLIKDTDFQIGF